MYFPVQIPRLSMDLVKRLFPLCEQLQIPMDQFVHEALAQAVARAEEGLEQKEAELRPAATGWGTGAGWPPRNLEKTPPVPD